MRLLRIAMTVAMIAFAALGSASAGPQGWGHEGAGKNGFHGEKGFLRILGKLDLNVDQEREIAAILGNHRAEIGNAAAGMMDARKGLREAMMADQFSEGAVRQAAQRVAEQQVQAIVLRAQIANEIKSVLTDEQKDRLKMFAQRRAWKMNGFIDAWLANLDEWIAGHSR